MFSVILNFSSLPFWQGVQSQPGVRECLPFSVRWHNAGYFVQNQVKEIEQNISKKYIKKNGNKEKANYRNKKNDKKYY